jgi:5-methylcytosine-specific restriction protein A
VTQRGTARQRGYDTRWEKYRAKFLAANPFCALCQQRGKLTRATVVDHIEPHKGDHRLFWKRENHQGLCASCHDGAKKQLERSGTLRGCDEDGVPLDPAHHWRRA